MQFAAFIQTVNRYRNRYRDRYRTHELTELSVDSDSDPDSDCDQTSCLNLWLTAQQTSKMPE